ncbi:unnamed protein product [Ranitomeya imitator]|uniref:Uncharacterized protein n=1 Tax=Ranitomeya imitator TaxID=111125 RepID=A0ABN9LWR9_9NEOB|nr:unnamed protein product [Ranitomeya imitator]
MAVRAGTAFYLAAACLLLLRSCTSLDGNQTTLYPEDLNATVTAPADDPGNTTITPAVNGTEPAVTTEAVTGPTATLVTATEPGLAATAAASTGSQRGTRGPAPESKCPRAPAPQRRPRHRPQQRPRHCPSPEAPPAGARQKI